MSPALLGHLGRNWPLALIAVGLLVYVPIALIRGEFYTNRGRILKRVEPARYWRWALAFIALAVSCAAVLVGSFLLSPR